MCTRFIDPFKECMISETGFVYITYKYTLYLLSEKRLRKSLVNNLVCGHDLRNKYMFLRLTITF